MAGALFAAGRRPGGGKNTNQAVALVENQTQASAYGGKRTTFIPFSAPRTGAEDLNDYKTRLFSLRKNLDEIIQQLRNSLCVDIRNEKLIENFPLILKSINPD